MRAFDNAITNMRRTPYQTVASILVMVLTFFLLLLFLVASYGSDRVLKHYEQAPKISAYFVDTATEADVEEVKQKLEQTGQVKTVRYISKSDALKIFTARFKDNPEITQFVQESFLPMAIDIQTKNPEDLETTYQTLQTFDKVERVVFLKDEIQKLLSWTRAVRTVGLAITIYSMVTSIFTILIVISMKIASKKDEIEILQLLGASPWYIRTPFLVEGMLYGVIGALIAVALGIVPFMYMQQPLAQFFNAQAEGFTVFPPTLLFIGSLVAIQVTMGIIIGAIGSFIALRRYLRL